MKATDNKFPDDLAYQIVYEYVSTDISQAELKKKYNFTGNTNIYRWMRKFGLSTTDIQTLDLENTMSKEKERTNLERDQAQKIKQLEEKLKREEFKTLALTTMIDIAERELKIEIRKKSGAKR